MDREAIMKSIIKRILSIREEMEMLQDICNTLPKADIDRIACEEDKKEVTLEYGRFIRIYYYYWQITPSEKIGSNPRLKDIGIVAIDWGCGYGK